MLRFKLGPRVDSVTVTRATLPATPPDEAPTALADVEPEIVDLDPESDPLRATLRIPAYDPATHHRLLSITAIVKPMGEPDPETPTAWVESAYPKVQVDTSALTAPGDVILDVPNVPDGLSVLQTILAFDAEDRA